MFHQCFTCVLLVLPLFVTADPIPLKKGVEVSKLAEHETLRMFDDFSTTFGRKYASPAEYKKRYAIFKDNLGTIDRLNREEQGTARYGITQFADLTYDEFVKNFTGGSIPQAEWERHEAAVEDEPVNIEFADDDFLSKIDTDTVSSEESEDKEELETADGTIYLPIDYDYREMMAVTAVKDQGNCGSCWAFSAIGNIEGLWAKAKNQLFNLTEQELVDCDKVDKGCNGGWMQNAVKELVRLGGVAKTSDYPYTGKQQTCKFTKNMAAVKVAGTISIPADERKIARAFVKYGPLSTAIVASSTFQFYKSGVFDPTPGQCSRDKTKVNHGVTFVAYGVEKQGGKKLPFWVIKNSWGASWGDEGYMKIVRGKNACAVSAYVSTAYLPEDPERQKRMRR